jgi:Ca2+-binding EF-hand superfamily protein
MSTVSSISSSSVASSYSNVSAAQKRHRPDASQMAEELFSKLDTSGKGYIEQSDLTSALSGLTSSTSTQTSSSTASASDIFSELDSNGDGKVTKDEFSTSLKKLAEQLDSQFNQARMDGAMPPPPPNGANGSSDTGFTQDELSQQLSEIGSSDSKRSSLINNIVQNFEKADTDSDGKVSFKEAMAYDQANSTTSSTSTSTSSSTASTTSSANSTTQASDEQVFRQLMELLRTYGDNNTSVSGLTSLVPKISTSA